MTPRQKLIKICELKAELIKEHTRITDYFTEADKQDILSWNNKMCLKIIKKMNKAFDPTFTAFDIYACPWCIYIEIENIFCINCTYGVRHGDCKDTKSTYVRILKILRNRGIYNLYGIPKLPNKIKKILKDK